MQDVTPWPESFDVSEPVARVLVDGELVDVESVTVTSELDSAMPERVAAGGGGVVAATGTASILRADDVTEAGFNPWGEAQTFVNASEVVVEAGYRDPETTEVGCARQITAQVESLDGGATTNSVGVDYVDHTPQLDRDITIEPLLRDYPPLEDRGPKRGAGLYPLYVTDRVLRHCGFYATPPMVSGAIVSAPLMGSAVPERGTLLSARANLDPTSHVRFRPVRWGMAMLNAVTQYVPDLGFRGHGRLNSTLHVSFHRQIQQRDDPTNGVIELRWGSHDNAIRITIGWNAQIRVDFRDEGSQTNVAVLSSVDGSASDAFTILISPSGAVTIHASNGTTVSGSAPIPSRLTQYSLDEVLCQVPHNAHLLGGLQVAFSDTTNHQFKPSAHLEPPDATHMLEAFPKHLNVNCLSLLKEQAEAELAAMWIDEAGHFRWRNRHQLTTAAPAGTLTSTDHLLDLPWGVPVRSVYSRVEVEHDVPKVTRRQVASITVSDRRGSTLVNGETEERFFEPPADQDWHLVETPLWMGSSSQIQSYYVKRGRGSYRGGVIVNDDDEQRLAYSSRLVQTWVQINPQRWLLSSEAQSLSAGEYIEQIFSDHPNLYGRFATEDLPVIRAKGLVEWEEQKTIGAARGAPLSQVYTHTVGPWIQDASELRSLADWLAESLTTPDVVLRRIPIVPDPRIQLGDVFWLEDQTAYQVRLRVVVMGKTLTYQSNNGQPEMAQEITCRVISVERLGTTYDELATAWTGRNYAALETAWSGQDYDALQHDPLEGS